MFFKHNGYPSGLFDSILSKFLVSIFSSQKPVSLASKQLLHVSLPFYGQNSFHIRKQLENLFSNCYPQVSFRFIFTNPFTIGSFFRYKDRVPKALCANVVYKFNCSHCNVGYIGSSIRNLRIRVSEHKGNSFRTGLPLSKPPLSEIREHALVEGHNFGIDDFEILLSNQDRSSLRIAESLFIRDLKPSLNNYDSAVKLITR